MKKKPILMINIFSNINITLILPYSKPRIKKCVVRHYEFKDYKSSETCQDLLSITDSHRDLIAKLKYNCTPQCNNIWRSNGTI